MSLVPAVDRTNQIFSEILVQVLQQLGAHKQAFGALVVIPVTRVIRAQLLAFEQGGAGGTTPAPDGPPWGAALGWAVRRAFWTAGAPAHVSWGGAAGRLRRVKIGDIVVRAPTHICRLFSVPAGPAPGGIPGTTSRLALGRWRLHHADG